MAKRKLQQFAEIKTFGNVIEPSFEEIVEHGFEFRGQWREKYFKNDKPIVLELGCGKGEYSVGQARMYPEKNFIGMDIKGNRIWRGAKTAFEEGISNVAFVRQHIGLITKFFAADEVDEIWVTFPDPQPREGHETKRLTSQRFLDYYRTILKPDGLIHLKTDNAPFFDFTLDVISENNHRLLFETHDLYNSSLDDQRLLSIKTYYEQIYLNQGVPICYLKFMLSREDR